MQHTDQQQPGVAVSRATWRQMSAERRACPDDGTIAWAIDTAGAELVRGLLDDPAPFALLAAAAAERAGESDAGLALCLLAAVGGQRSRAVWQSRHRRGGQPRRRRQRGRGRRSGCGFATATDGLRAGLAQLQAAA
jgi:hypothetical protein